MGRRFGKSDLTELRSQVGWVSSVVAEEMPSRLSAREVVLSGCQGTIGIFEEVSQEMEETADFFLDMMGIAEIADRAFGILSQGERMRTLIARALASRPILLILDEPCAGLDPVARTRFLEILNTLLEHPDAPPVLLVTHHVEEIVDGISHVIGLREGVVVATGTKEEMLSSATMSRIFNADIDLIEEENYRTIKVNL
jgi:iron complex transport system ATP-binding protein